MKAFLAGLAAAIFLSAGSAGAVVISFDDEANTGGERGVADAAVLNTADLGGLNLRLSGGRGASASDFAYFNAGEAAMAGSRGRAAGLGVCSSLDSLLTCAATVDDTVAHGEFVRIDFVDAPFQIRRLSFNGRFSSLDGSALLLNISTSLAGVISSMLLSFADATGRDFGLVDWIRFEFVRGQGDNAKFFVAEISDVPVPGALPLLLSGLAGLGFAASRRKAS